MYILFAHGFLIEFILDYLNKALISILKLRSLHPVGIFLTVIKHRFLKRLLVLENLERILWNKERSWIQVINFVSNTKRTSWKWLHKNHPKKIIHWRKPYTDTAFSSKTQKLLSFLVPILQHFEHVKVLFLTQKALHCVLCKAVIKQVRLYHLNSKRYIATD